MAQYAAWCHSLLCIYCQRQSNDFCSTTQLPLVTLFTCLHAITYPGTVDMVKGLRHSETRSVILSILANVYIHRGIVGYIKTKGRLYKMMDLISAARYDCIKTCGVVTWCPHGIRTEFLIRIPFILNWARHMMKH